MKFEKEFRIDNPQTIGETDSHFDLQNYNEWLESKHDQLHSELEKAKELVTKKDVEIAMLERAIRELKGDTSKNNKGEY